MNITDHHNAIHKKANQMRTALWSFVAAASASYLVWEFGGGAPWWVYAMFFARSVVGFAQALTDEPAMQQASADCSDALAISARDAGVFDFENSAFEASGLSAD